MRFRIYGGHRLLSNGGRIENYEGINICQTGHRDGLLAIAHHPLSRSFRWQRNHFFVARSLLFLQISTNRIEIVIEFFRIRIAHLADFLDSAQVVDLGLHLVFPNMTLSLNRPYSSGSFFFLTGPHRRSLLISSSPASESTRCRIASDIHMPVLANRSTWVAMLSTKPCDFASMRTLSVPHTSSPADSAIRRAGRSSKRTVQSECANASAKTANSPSPKSKFDHSGGATQASMIHSHS